MRVTYFGHASIGIEASDGTRILLDPYEPDAFGGRLAYSAIPGQWDYICISHDHADHNYVGPEFGHPVVIRGDYEDARLRVSARRGKHGDAGGTVDAVVTSLVIEVDGMRIGHPGDLGPELSPDWFAFFSGLDLLFLPVGGHFTMGPADAWSIVTTSRPRVAVPIHYKTPSTGFPLGPVEPFLQLAGRHKDVGASTLEFDASTLPARPEVWLMRPMLGRLNPWP